MRRETMTTPEAAERLGIPVSRVRRLCKVHQRADFDPSVGLAFAWAVEPAKWPSGRVKDQGERRPYVDAVEAYAEALRVKAEAAPETMGMGEAAALLRVSVRQVRKWCERDELPYEWTHDLMPRKDALGRTLQGHRRPHAEAVRALAAERLRKKVQALAEQSRKEG